MPDEGLEPPRNKGFGIPLTRRPWRRSSPHARGRRRPPWLAASCPIVVLWRGGLRIQEALRSAKPTSTAAEARYSYTTAEAAGAARSAWTRRDGSSCGPGSPRAWSYRSDRCSGIIDGPTRGRPWSAASVRVEFRPSPCRPVSGAGSRRTSCATPSVLERGASERIDKRRRRTVELAREGVQLNAIQRQLGHANLSTTSIYLQGIDTEEIIATAHAISQEGDAHPGPPQAEVPQASGGASRRTRLKPPLRSSPSQLSCIRSGGLGPARRAGAQVR